MQIKYNSDTAFLSLFLSCILFPSPLFTISFKLDFYWFLLELLVIQRETIHESSILQRSFKDKTLDIEPSHLWLLDKSNRVVELKGQYNHLQSLSPYHVWGTGFWQHLHKAIAIIPPVNRWGKKGLADLPRKLRGSQPRLTPGLPLFTQTLWLSLGPALVT